MKSAMVKHIIEFFLVHYFDILRLFRVESNFQGRSSFGKRSDNQIYCTGLWAGRLGGDRLDAHSISR